MKLKNLLLLFAVGTFSQLLPAQVPQFEWANALNGVSGSGAKSKGYSVTTDPSGNNYSVGYFTGTIDFDPGAGVFNMTTTGWGMFVRKLDAAGNFLWAKMASSTTQSEALDVVANSTNVYVTGYFSGTVDFDPNASVNNATSAGNQDLFIWGLSANGVFSSLFQTGGTGIDRGSAIDLVGPNLFVTGVFSGTFDANPDPVLTNTITSNGQTDILIMKVAMSSGNLVWIQTIGSFAIDVTNGMEGKDPLDIAVSSVNGKIGVTGDIGNSADIDPTAGVMNALPGFFVIQLTGSGGFDWGVGAISGFATGIDFDNSGNVYTTGAQFFVSGGNGLDGFLRKYNSSGSLQWVIFLGENDDDYGRAVVVGNSGDIYLTGTIGSASVDFDPSGSTALLSSSGDQDIYIAGYSNSGAYLWVKKIGAGGTERSYAIATDYSGAIYTSGYYKNVVDFHTEAGVYNLPLAGYVSSPDQDAFLHKLGAECLISPTDPGFEWATDMGGNGDAYCQAVETDASGNVYSSGHFTGTIDFDPGSGTSFLTSIDLFDIFLQKQDAAGNLIWVRQISGKGSQLCYKLSIDNAGNIAIGGTFNDDIDMDPGIATSYLTTNGLEDIMIIKIDPSGNFIWGKRMGGTGSDVCYSVNFDASGNVGSTGFFSTTVDFDPNVGVSNLTVVGATDMYVQKLDVNGNLIWIKQMAGAGAEEGRSLCFDQNGAVYVTGNFAGTTNFYYSGSPANNLTAVGSTDVFVLRLLTNGNTSWLRQIGGSGNDRASAIALDANYNFLYTTGYFSGTASVNGTSITSAGSDDVYLLKINTSGINAWVKKIGEATGTVRSQAVDTDDCGDVYVTGSYSSLCDFDPNAGIFNLTAIGSLTDVFIVKLHHSGAFAWAKSMGGTSSESAYGIDVDIAGSVHTAGNFTSTTADFNPGVSVFNLFANTGRSDVFVQKLNISFPVLQFYNPEATESVSPVRLISIVPNPNAGQFSVSFGIPTNGLLEVFDVNGQVVERIDVNETALLQINLEGFAKGIYLVRFTDGRFSETKRIVVQ